MPFQSEKQRRYLWANEPEIARDWTDTYGSGIAKALGGRIGFYSQRKFPPVTVVEDQYLVDKINAIQQAINGRDPGLMRTDTWSELQSGGSRRIQILQSSGSGPHGKGIMEWPKILIANLGPIRHRITLDLIQDLTEVMESEVKHFNKNLRNLQSLQF